MLQPPASSPLDLAAKAVEAAQLMKVLSNEHRLLILCHLIEADELAVGGLVGRIGLSQSALSQHLARLREEGLVAFRRESQTLFYRVADPRAGWVLHLLRDIYCPELGAVVASGKSRIDRRPKRADKPARGD